MTKTLWLAGGALALCLALITGQRAWLKSEYNRGRSEVLSQAARVESVYVDRVVQAKARTDTVWRTRTLPAIARAETLIVQVPESVRVAFPAVDQALRACTEATDSCKAFREQVTVERGARDSLEYSLRLGTVARHDSITSLSKRPTWKRSIFTAALTGAAAFLCGRQC